MIIVALHNQHYSHVIRLANQAMFDLERAAAKKSSNIEMDVCNEMMLCLLVQALVQLGAAQAIQGVQAWTLRVFKKKLVWTNAAAEMSIGR